MTRSSKFRTVFFAFCFGVSMSAFSQQNFNVAGHTAVINGMTFDYSIGEMTLITTERNANLTVTQGLLQPTGPGNGANTQPGNTHTLPATDLVKVYPNPTENILFVESVENLEAEFSYQLFDVAGKVVLSKTLLQKKGVNKYSLDLRQFAAGSYYLVIRKLNAEGEYENYSYKIQKSN